MITGVDDDFKVWRRDSENNRYEMAWPLLEDFDNVLFLARDDDPIVAAVAKLELVKKYSGMRIASTPFSSNQLNSMAYDAVVDDELPEFPDDPEYMQRYYFWRGVANNHADRDDY